MRIARYEQIIRARWALVVATTLACTAFAAGLAWTAAPTYTAETQLFVSTTGLPAQQRQAHQPYQGGLHAQQRARSYAALISGSPGARAVIEDLGLVESVESVQERIRAFVPLHSVLIDVHVTDRSPALAKSMADSLTERLPQLVEDLEHPQSGEGSPVQVAVTKPAMVPIGPDSPRRSLYLAAGAILGLAIGLGGAVLRHAIDRRIRDEADARAAGVPVLGRIAADPGQELVPVTLARPLSPAAESYRGLRANLSALSAEHDLRSFVVSSAVGKEGKTEVVANLGLALAEAGERVVVVDASARSGNLGERLGVHSHIGLTDLIQGRWSIDLALRRHPAARLEVLTAGSPASGAGTPVGSEALDRLLGVLVTRFDYILLDAPALLPVADAAVLVARVSAVILVARAGATRAEDLSAARRTVDAAGGRFLGVVLTGTTERGHVSRPEVSTPVRGRSGEVESRTPERSR